MNIYKVSASYLIDQFSMTIFEYIDIKETDKSFMFDGNRLSKDKLNKIEIDISKANMARGHVYVLHENVKEYQELLYQEFQNELNKYQEQLTKTIADTNNWDKVARFKKVD